METANNTRNESTTVTRGSTANMPDLSFKSFLIYFISNITSIDLKNVEHFEYQEQFRPLFFLLTLELIIGIICSFACHFDYLFTIRFLTPFFLSLFLLGKIQTTETTLSTFLYVNIVSLLNIVFGFYNHLSFLSLCDSNQVSTHRILFESSFCMEMNNGLTPTHISLLLILPPLLYLYSLRICWLVFSVACFVNNYIFYYHSLNLYSNFSVTMIFSTLVFIYTSVEAKNNEINREETYRRLQLLKNAAQERDKVRREKEKLMNVIFHDVRVHFQNLVFGIEQLAATISIEKRTTLVEMTKSSNTMHSILSNVLDLSKLEENFKVNPNDIFLLCKETQSILKSFNTYASRKSVKLQLKYDTNTLEKVKIKWDYRRFQQVLGNFVSNAIKFTANDTQVTVTVEALDQVFPSDYILDDDNNPPSSEPGKKYFRITISDKGSGVPVSKRNQIFRRYCDPDTNQLVVGSGLGLATTYLLAEKRCGFNTSNKGSNFFFDIETELSEQSVDDNESSDFRWYLIDIENLSSKQTKSDTQSSVLANKKILLVDDGEALLALFSKRLVSQGAKCVCAKSYEEAIKLKDQFETFDLIITDRNLSKDEEGKQGTDLISEIKSITSKPIIFGMTADGYALNKNEMKAAGAQEVMIKPFTLQTFCDVYSNILNPQN